MQCHSQSSQCGFSVQPKGSKPRCSNLIQTQAFQGEGAAAWVQLASHQATVSSLLLDQVSRTQSGYECPGPPGPLSEVQEPLPSSRTCTDRQGEKEDKEVPPTPPGGLSC